MIVNVRYVREDGSVVGRSYSYRTRLPLKKGERVFAPTSSGPRSAEVVAVDVPESAVDPSVLPELREIVHTDPGPVTDEIDAAPTVEATVSVVPAEAGAESGNASPEVNAPDVEELVRVTQLPVIVERLRQMKDYVEGMTEEAVALACTEDTVQTVKQRRADLNRFFKELEDKRKAVKAAVMGPYTAFEAVYNECICNPFNDADAKLKAKIDEVEGEQKRRCEERMRAWFAEVAQVHGVSWLTFDMTGCKVDLTSAKQKTPQKLMDKLNEFCARVALDVEAISGMENAVEIMAEYKKTLNMAVSVRVVKERHEAMERERIEAEERKQAQIARLEAEKRVEDAAPEVLQPPVVQAEEGKILRSAQDDKKVYKCSFTVRATKDQLRALKDFMKQEGISYE